MDNDHFSRQHTTQTSKLRLKLKLKNSQQYSLILEKRKCTHSAKTLPGFI